MRFINYADPGTTKGTAVATFTTAGLLVGLCIIKAEANGVPYVARHWGSPQTGPCLWEMPQVYPYGKLSLSRMTAQANDLINLAAAGSAAAMFVSQGLGIRTIKPREWKGQVKKYHHHRKVLEVLSPQELAIVCEAYGSTPTELQNYIYAACNGGPYGAQITDLLDAVALGLSDNGRLRIV